LWCVFVRDEFKCINVFSTSQEFQQGNQQLVIENPEPRHTVYIYKCENSVVQIKGGKVNAITIGMLCSPILSRNLACAKLYLFLPMQTAARKLVLYSRMLSLWWKLSTATPSKCKSMAKYRVSSSTKPLAPKSFSLMRVWIPR